MRAQESDQTVAVRAGWYGYFADPEGNLREVAHNPDFPIDAAGNISLPA